MEGEIESEFDVVREDVEFKAVYKQLYAGLYMEGY